MTAGDRRTDRLWRVRVLAGQALVHEYVWSSEEHARQFVASLDASMSAEIVEPKDTAVAVAPAPARGEATGSRTPDGSERYQVYVSVSARHQLKDLPASEWSDILGRLIDLAHGAGDSIHGSREALQAAGIEPPYLRLRAGNHLLICDANPAGRAVTVLHVLPTAEASHGEPSGE